MHLVFTIGNDVKFETKLNLSLNELLPNYSKSRSNYNRNNTFKIPLNKTLTNSSKKNSKRIYYDDEDDSSSDSSIDYSDEIEEEDDGFDNNDGTKSNNLSNDGSLGKVLRKHQRPEIVDLDSYLNNSLLGYKKPKKELTEDDINKKNEQIQKRKNHAKRQLEEEKRQTIEKILNEDGRKLRERQRKFNEDNIKKELDLEEKYKASLTKIKMKFQKDGKIYVRFPQGLLLPKFLKQKQTEDSKKTNNLKCQVEKCSNAKKYKDPKSQLFYCSVDCYRKIKNNKIDLTQN